MKYTITAIIGVVVIALVFAAIMYQPYGECLALNKDLQEDLRLMKKVLDNIGLQNDVYSTLAENYDLKKAEYLAQCRALM